MAWQSEMVRILRHLIADISTTSPVYDNSRLEEVILVSAQLMQNELDFPQTYTVDVDERILSPDPTQNTKDASFINLVCLRGAVLVLGSEYKTSSTNSIRVSDGPSSIDMTDVTRNAKLLYDSALAALEKAKIDYRAGNSIAGEAVLTPYTFEGIRGFYNPR